MYISRAVAAVLACRLTSAKRHKSFQDSFSVSGKTTLRLEIIQLQELEKSLSHCGILRTFDNGQKKTKTKPSNFRIC